MLSLIIPYYNDSGCPGIFINELRKELRGINYELILVDDCSKDTTPKELDYLKNKNIHVIHNKQNLDYGGAITTGLKKASGDILGFTCGDGEVSAKEIVRVYKTMDKSDVIKAIRINRQDGLNRKIISWVFNIMTSLRFRINLRDINGYPLFLKKKIYAELPQLRRDWLFNTDLIRNILERGYKIDEIEVSHEKRLKGKSHMTFKRIARMTKGFFKYK